MERQDLIEKIRRHIEGRYTEYMPCKYVDNIYHYASREHVERLDECDLYTLETIWNSINVPKRDIDAITFRIDGICYLLKDAKDYYWQKGDSECEVWMSGEKQMTGLLSDYFNSPPN